ncbi:MAG TPA: trypsin-like serine protease [Gemmatimonadaceae bacterium]|jgi:secreted trypsin-like serine protease|nr:trypsin-like serine protease [Gemmatimonadaceae bacterium]
MRFATLGPAVIIAALLSACDTAPSTTPLISAKDTPSRITHGTTDGNAHPGVVLIVMDVAGQPAFRCSGSMLTARIVLTAGHCAGEPGEFSGMRVFTESDVEHGNNNYPSAGPNTIEAKEWHAHPLFTEAQFFLHDVGVVVLSQPFNLASSAYSKLPSAGTLDALQPSAHTTFTAVGYGVQRINPAKVVEELIRETAQPHLIQINTGFTGPQSLLLSNNASTGGTCFGDSGGPNYLGTSSVVAGVTSFGINNTCGGTGGVFRLDKQDVIDFVGKYLK